MLEAVSQVSCRHSTSIVCASSSMYSLNRLTPAMFILPMFKPVLVHRSTRSFLVFLYLIDPFVRFLLTLVFSSCTSCALFGTLSVLICSSTFMICALVALAHRGASPLPTPAGLKLGG